MTTDNHPEPEQLLVRVDQAARMLAVSRRTLYVLAARGDIHLCHIGRASRIHIDDIRKFAANLGADKAVRP